MFGTNPEAPAVIPVVTIRELDSAESIFHALRDGGMNYIEIAMRTEASMEALKIASTVNGVVAGAGTVTSVNVLEKVLQNGAEFIITPGYSQEVTTESIKLGIPIVPGVATPGEVMMAQNSGIDKVKLFPANSLGGVDYLKNLAGPFPEMKFLPSGGVNHNNFKNYLSQQNVFAVSGSWMLPRDLIEKSDYLAIRDLVETVMKAAQN